MCGDERMVEGKVSRTPNVGKQSQQGQHWPQLLLSKARVDWELLELAGRGNRMLLQLVVAFESPLGRLFGGSTLAWKVGDSEIASQTLLPNQANQRMSVPEASRVMT
jgi:hypothetical protein